MLMDYHHRFISHVHLGKNQWKMWEVCSDKWEGDWMDLSVSHTKAFLLIKIPYFVYKVFF